MGRPIVVRDDAGRPAFAFDPSTDPFEVLRLVAWAYPEHVPLCGMPSCPACEGSYCVDCHSVGWAALAAARRRFPALSAHGES